MSIVENVKNRAIDSYARYIKFNEPFTEEVRVELNDLFSYSITNDTLHIHVVSASVKDDIVRMGTKTLFCICGRKTFRCV